jgi:hypothetical protein
MAKSLRQEPAEVPATAADVQRGIRRLRRVAREIPEPVDELVARVMEILDRHGTSTPTRRVVRRDADLREAVAKYGEDMVAAALLFDPLRARWMAAMEGLRIIRERMLAERGGVPFPDSTPMIREDRLSH